MDAEQLFLQFQKTREPAHLGAVFDLVADDLFGFALHLCRDQAGAEDLLQATFLRALERAHHYDSKRPLRPWLLGILQREARAMRRQARRAPDPARVPVYFEPPPVHIALRAEVADAVAAGIASVPQPYRSVLELRLVQSLENGEIAERLRRSPGSVRTQLWRGLELLRQLLPKGLAVALAAQLNRPGLSAVRQRVLHAAAAPVGAAATGMVIGVLLMQKIALGVAAIAVLAVGWWAWPHAPAPLEPNADTPPIASAAAAPTGQPPPAARTLASEAAAAAAAVSPAQANAVAQVSVSALVVDGKGDPVADAEVGVFEPLLFMEPDGKLRPGGCRGPGPPSWTAHTDTFGRVAFAVDRPCFVSARKESIGASGDVRLNPGMAELRDELRIQLMEVCHVRGQVVSSDGAPAAAARVGCQNACFQGRHLADSLPSVETDAEGKFTFEVLRGLEYVVATQVGDRGVHCQVDAREGGPDYAVTLRLPGMYSVRGVLLGADGRPTSGWVKLIADPQHPGFEAVKGAYQAERPGADGHFEMLLSQAGGYCVIGGVLGQTAAHAAIVIDDSNPHAQLVLRVSPFLALAGRVVDEKGNPCSGVAVNGAPMVGHDALQQQRSEVQGPHEGATTAKDGSFRILVPGGCSYRLGYQPSRHLWAWGPELMPPVEDAVLVKQRADQQGFEVEGRVVSAATGELVNVVSVLLITHAQGGYVNKESVAESREGTFAIGPLPVGQRYSPHGTPPAGQSYSLRISVAGFADAMIGPFEPTVRKEQVTVRMHAWGSVVCEVLRPDGTPAVKAEVSLLPASGRFWFDRDQDGVTDQDGRMRFEQVLPGDFTIKVVGAANGGKAEAGGSVQPGQEARVLVTLKP